MAQNECWHTYMLYNGKNISEGYEYELLEHCSNALNPTIYDILDGRKNIAEHYKYCPKCGEKLNWRKIRKELIKAWEVDPTRILLINKSKQ